MQAPINRYTPHELSIEEVEQTIQDFVNCAALAQTAGVRWCGPAVESAVTALPGLNRLPHPLASVIFHYHQTQDYPPEFVAMGSPPFRGAPT